MLRLTEDQHQRLTHLLHNTQATEEDWLSFLGAINNRNANISFTLAHALLQRCVKNSPSRVSLLREHLEETPVQLLLPLEY